MAKCRQCNVTISDNTTICPLCQCVVEADEPATVAEAAGSSIAVGAATLVESTGSSTADETATLVEATGSSTADALHTGPDLQHINQYPDVWLKYRRVKHLCNLILAAVLTASGVLAALNCALPGDSWWCLIPIAAMAYMYLVFRLVFVSRKGYRCKVFVPLILALLLLLVIDIETGFYGWSVNYVFPSGILAADLIILILMLANSKNWQSYMIMQIVAAAVSLIPIILWLAGIITSPLLSLIAVGVSVFLFLGALIIGDRTARSELRRRFHIR